MHLSDAQFEQWVKDAARLLPRKFADALRNIAIDVEPYPSMKTRRLLGLRRGRMLLGLYTGTPLTERTTHYAAYGAVPDKIVLYKRCIEDACATSEDVRREVALTLLHEIGHYFGMTEDQLSEFEISETPEPIEGLDDPSPDST